MQSVNYNMVWLFGCMTTLARTGGFQPVVCCMQKSPCISANSTYKVDIFWLDGHSACIDGTIVTHFEQLDENVFRKLLDSVDGSRFPLETNIRFVIIRNFTHGAVKASLVQQ